MALLSVIAAARGIAPPKDLRFWGACLAMGILNNAIPLTLFTFAQTEIESGLVAILNATTAIFGVLVEAALLGDERLSLRRLAGVALGIAGVAAIMGVEALSSFDIRSLAQIACLAAAIPYAFVSVWTRLKLTGHPPLIVAAGMLTGSACW